MRVLSFVLGLVSLLVLACSNSADDQVHKEMLQIDHLIIGVADLDAGVREFEEITGIRPAYGGEHPHLGTHNALISLGDRTYLEILAPRPSANVTESLQFLAQLPEITPVMWAVSTNNITETADRLASAGYEVTEPVPGSRRQENGSTLHWTILEMAAPNLAGAPFFIEWSEISVHPSESSPGGCELGSLEIKDPRPDQLQGLIQLLGLNINVERAASSLLTFDLHCPNGEIRLGR
ncbi:MAG: VOC family protein [Proteobacteria bacterium]|nr:VOC family protein [Pseudomonadota bacterium]